ncbi:MAG: hypothetical protein QHH17_08170, partial [Candidatus Bathyarchaeota archaeon]|nr:hypothetical protein [Candidatus Bathyarchaeota archaeon]
MPEILMGKYIVGFDTISYYVPAIWKWMNYGVGFWEFLGSAPLFYLLLSGLTLAGVPLIVSLKVLPPILHGFLGFAIFKYATKGLRWTSSNGLLVSLLSTLYFVGLRISWDMLRCELGLIFLFSFLIILQKCSSEFEWKWFGTLSFLAVLVAMAHQLVSIIMFVIVFAVALEKLKKQNYPFATCIFTACLPATALFMLTVYADYIVLPRYTEDIVASGYREWLSLMGYSLMADGIAHTVGFLLFCYLPLLSFAFLGFRKFRNSELKVWVLWCFVGTSLSFIFPLAPLAYRWILLLVFPLAFFAVKGCEKLNSSLLPKVLAGFVVLLSFS